MKDEQRHESQREVFGSIYILGQHLTRCSDEALRPLGITTRQWLLMAVLAKLFPGQDPTLSETAAIYGTSRQNVKQVALLLERQGYLNLISATSDRRTRRIQLTSKVEVFNVPSEVRRQNAFMNQLFACLSESDLENLQRIVRRWISHIAKL